MVELHGEAAEPKSARTEIAVAAEDEGEISGTRVMIIRTTASGDIVAARIASRAQAVPSERIVAATSARCAQGKERKSAEVTETVERDPDAMTERFTTTTARPAGAPVLVDPSVASAYGAQSPNGPL